MGHFARHCRLQHCCIGSLGTALAGKQASCEGKSSTPSSAAAASTSNDSTAQWRIYTDTARRMASQGQHQEASQYLARALQEARAGFGEGDPHVAAACHNLAEIHRLRRQYQEAEPLYHEAIACLTASFGPEDVRVARAHASLGSLHAARGDFEDARQHFAYSVKMSQAAQGPLHPSAAAALKPLVQLFWREGDASMAVALQQHACGILDSEASQAASGNLQERGLLLTMLLATQQWEAALPAARQLLQRSHLHQDAAPQPSLELCYELLAKALIGSSRAEEAGHVCQQGINLIQAQDSPSATAQQAARRLQGLQAVCAAIRAEQPGGGSQGSGS